MRPGPARERAGALGHQQLPQRSSALRLGLNWGALGVGVKVGLIQNAVTHPTTAPFAEQQSAIRQRVGELLDAAGESLEPY